MINIIHSRDKQIQNQQQDEDEEDIDIESDNIINTTSISSLSYDLVSNIGSYLEFYELLKYQLSNRHIYISCKHNISPISKITNIEHLSWYESYISNNFGTQTARIKQLRQFSNAKHIQLYTHEFDSITNNNQNPKQWIWNNIQHLHLVENEIILRL